MTVERQWRRWYPALVAALAAERLVELRLSRRNELLSGTAIGTAGGRSYPLMVATHVALFTLPLVESRRYPRAASPWLIGPAVVGLAAATLLRLCVIRSLGTGWNVRGRVHEGLRIVSSGPYHYVRHPNYVAVAVEMAALPLAAPAPLSAALLSAANALVLAPRIRAEERLLRQVPGYSERMERLPRFVPGAPAALRFIGVLHRLVVRA